MNSSRYWKNRLPFLLTNLVCMAALTVFLLVCGNSVSAVLLILIVWALILLAGLVLTYWKRKRQMKKLLDMAEQLSERYLISEVMELPEQAEDQVYYQLLKMAGKSMLEQIGEVERQYGRLCIHTAESDRLRDFYLHSRMFFICIKCYEMGCLPGSHGVCRACQFRSDLSG